MTKKISRTGARARSQSAPGGSMRCVCKSIRPGRSVASPSLMIGAPGGRRDGLTALIRSPSTTTTAGLMTVPVAASKSRSARITVVSAEAFVTIRETAKDRSSGRNTGLVFPPRKFPKDKIFLFGSDGRVNLFVTIFPSGHPQRV